MKHAAYQHPQAPIEFRLPERLSEHRRVIVAFTKTVIRASDEGERDTFGTEPLGYRVYCFAVFKSDVEQRRIAWGRVDQRERLGKP